MADQDKPDALLEYRIGRMYLNGNGTAENAAEALRWFEKSANNGNLFAAYEAATLMETGQKVPVNPIRSQIYYNQVLNGFIKTDLVTPDSNLEYRIGLMFFKGKGTALDIDAATKWLNLSSSKGNPYAQFQLAEIYRKGEWTLQNEEYARRLYFSALAGFKNILRSQPNSNLLFKIGTMYEMGLGVDRDMSVAKSWYTLSANSSNEVASERLNQISAFESKAAVASIYNLFRSLARGMGNNINDSTTHKFRPERKLLQKQREMSHGQRHSQEQTG